MEAELIRLACADTNGLARRWRVLFGARAPDLPRALLQRILAYRIQADAAGDLDPTTIKLLDRLGRGEIAEIALRSCGPPSGGHCMASASGRKIAAIASRKGTWMGGLVLARLPGRDLGLHIVEAPMHPDQAPVRRLSRARLRQRPQVSARCRWPACARARRWSRSALRRQAVQPGPPDTILATQSTSGSSRTRGRPTRPASRDRGAGDLGCAQAQLASHAHRRACRQLASAHLLMGRIQDDRGHAMTPTHAQKGSRRYRYYVSQAVLQGKPERRIDARVPAPEIEALVIGAMRSASPTNPELSDGDLILNHLHRVTLHEGRIEMRSTAKMKLRSTCPGPDSRRSAVVRSWCRRAASLTCVR